METSDMEFGGSGIVEELYEWITKNIPFGSTIVEFGAGDVSTRALCEKWTLFSVENNPQWIGRWNSNYIYAPIVNGWFDIDILKKELPLSYSLLIVDGPTAVGSADRSYILDHLDMIRKDVPIVIDDTWRDQEKYLASIMAVKMGKFVEDYGQFSILVNK